MSEEPTTTFGKLAIGDVFRAPLTYQIMRKVNEGQAIGLATGATYNCYPNKPVRQDWYIEQEAKQLSGG